MKETRRLISGLLAFSMLLAMLPMQAFATVGTATEPVAVTESVAETVVAETTETVLPEEPNTEAAVTVETTAPPEETTVPVTEALVEENTEALTEPETVQTESTLPAETEEAPTEPSEETLPLVSKETYVATETAVAEEETIPEETVLKETVPEQTQALVTRHSYTVVPDAELPDENELLSGYLDQLFGKKVSVLGDAAGQRLTGDTKLMYDALVGVIQDIAAGNRKSAWVSVGADLGEVEYTDGTTEVINADVDVEFKGTEPTQEQMDLLMDALLSDLPYEQYWLDKVIGFEAYSLTSTEGDLLWVEFYFAVAGNYNDGTNYITVTRIDAETSQEYDVNLYYKPDTAKTGAAATTAANAKTVVNNVAQDIAAKNSADPDYETLLAYKNWICDTVSYNHDAAEKNNFSEKSDPWQLIYVFDGDDTTNVVCEGYSKAFQYLCDLTTFVDKDALCYCVTGYMDDEGHMWNIMELNGGRYLVDVTNSEADTIGDDGSLFLAGAEANADGSYSFAGATFTYDEDTQTLWGDDGILTLSTTDYEPSVEEDTGNSTDEMTQEAFIAAMAAAGGEYELTANVTLTEDMVISGNVTIAENAALTVAENVTVTVYDQLYIAERGKLVLDSGASLVNYGTINVYGELVKNGSLSGHGQIAVSDSATVTIPEMTQDEFKAAVAAAEAAGQNYYLSANVTLTSDMTIKREVHVEKLSSLTVASGTLTVNDGLAQLVAEGGTITIQNGAKLDVVEGKAQVWGGGSLIFEDGADMSGIQADEVWINMTEGTNTVTTLTDDMLGAMFTPNSAADILAAYAQTDNYARVGVWPLNDLVLDQSIRIPEGDDLCLVHGATVTVSAGVTLTNNGNIRIDAGNRLEILESGALDNHGTITVNQNGQLYYCVGTLTNSGTIDGDGDIITNGMTQEDFAAAVAEAAEKGEVYTLTDNVTLTSDMSIVSEVHVAEGGSLTVSGSTLTVGGDDGFGHLIANGGTITINSDAALSIVSGGLMQVWGGGTLTIKNGADITGVDADEVWINLTEEGVNTVNGLEDAMLGAIYNPYDAAGLEAAYVLSDTYAHIGVYPNASFTLDRSITIPEGDDLNLLNQVTLTVPADFTLTNNGLINIDAENRLEVLEGGALVNNDTITVNRYAQLYYYEGTLTNNGTIQGDGDIVTNKMSHQALIDVLAECEANGTSWVLESEVTLDPDVNDGRLEISMGGGDPSPEFYLVEGGVLRVPSDTCLEVYNPLIVLEGGKVIIEEGGKLIVNGLLSVEGGTVYIAGDFEEGENRQINGRLTFAGETDPWLSGRWLDDWGQGWFENTENAIDENAGRGCSTMNSAYKIFYLNIWDSENLCWSTTPVVPTASSTGNYSITRLLDTDEAVKADEENAEYFVRVDVGGSLDHRDDTISVNHNGQTYTLDFALWSRDLAFYTSQEDTVDTIITGHEFILDTSEGAENAVYLIQRDERTISEIEWEINSWNGEDYNELVSDGEFLNYEEITKGKVWKITVDPEFVDYVRYDYKNFELRYTAQVTDTEGNVETFSDGVWINPPELLEPAANLRIDYSNYMVFETGAVFMDYFTGEYDEWGNEIWARKSASLPAGVSYIPAENKLILDNAHLEHLDLNWYESGYDNEGHFWEHHGLPNENLTITLVGENTITNHSEFTMMVRHGTNVTFTGNGQLHLYAENSPYNVNEEGNRYAYPTVALQDGSSLNFSGNVSVIAEVAGYGFHEDWPAQMEAISGHNDSEGSSDNALTLSGNAQLTIVTPEGTRTLDESQENYGGARGITNVSIEVNDNATLNTGSIYLWEGVDFTMNGGTVNLDPIGEVFYNYRLEDLLLSNLGIYLEHEDSVFTMNGGTINMDLNPNEANDGNFNYNTFQGINAALGHVYINGGEININGENAMGGNGIAIQCGWTEDGPDFSAPASSLTITGGTVNISGVEGEFEGIYVAPAASAELSGGAVYAYGGENYFEGHVDWIGNTELTGNIYVLDGSDVIVKNGATMVIDQEATVMDGSRIIVEDGGTLHVGGWLTVEGQGLVLIRHGGSFTTSEGEHVSGKITFEGDTAPYLTSTWLDNHGEGWYMNDEFHVTDGLMSMEDHWRIFFLNTWDATNLVWNSVPVVPTENNEFMTITRILDMEDQIIREDQEYSEYFVCVNITDTLDYHEVSLYANGYTLPFRIYDRMTGFYRTTEASLDTIIFGHDFTLDTTAEENAVYWIVKNIEDYDVLSWEVNYNTWDEDYTEYTGGDELVTVTDLGNGVYKFTVDPDYVDYIQYDWKNFEIQMHMVLDYNGDDQILEEHYNYGLWMHAPDLLDPAATLNINNSEYMIFDTGRIFRDYFTGAYDEWGNEIWRRQETGLPKGVSYVLKNNQLILDNAKLTSLDLHPTVSGYDEEGNFWKVPGLPNENLTITLVGNSTIENHCNAALWFNDGTNATITGNGSLYAMTTNYPDYRDENGELQCFNTINVHGGSSLTIGGNATVTAELSGHGYWGNGEGATCHPISGSYDGSTLEITDNATVTTVLPNGVRRYDESGYTSQIGGYVGIQNFNSVTVSGGTLNTDHLNFYDGGQFNLTGGVANFRDIGGVNKNPETDEMHYHYEGINMRGGSVNISGGELNIDVSPRDGETPDTTSFYGINVVNGTMDVTGGTINITGGISDGWAILADCEWTDEGWVDGTGSTLNVTGGTINIKAAEHTYHGGILVSEICEGNFNGGEIIDDYGIHRFCGDTYWKNTELYGVAANVYTHGPGSFYMSGGVIDLVGDSYEENGEIIRNRAIFQPNAGGSISGGEIRLANGTYINNMNVSFDGGKITIENDWPEVPGLENNLYFPINSGTIDITANGVAIVNGGTFHQMGGTVTATNTSGTRPVMISTGTVMQNTGVLNLNSENGVGLVQGYDFELAADEEEGNESMLFIGAVDDLPAPELNINSKYGILLNGPGFITGGANVNIHVQGEPINEGMDWPVGIFVEKHTGNEDLSGDNVSNLVITGGANVHLTSVDTAGVDAMSKGIVAWYAPVEIGSETADANVIIDAEMAIYSMSNSAEESNLTIMQDVRSTVTGEFLALSCIDNGDGTYLHTLQESDGSYAGSVKITHVATVSSLDELKALMTYNGTSGRWHLSRPVAITGSFALTDIIVDVINGGELVITDGMILTISEDSHLIAQQNSRILVEAGGRINNYGIFASDLGAVSVTDGKNEDGTVYAGYVHNDGATLNCHYRDGVMSAIKGISMDLITLFCDDQWTCDKIQAILGLEDRTEYKLICLNVANDLELAHDMRLPGNMEMHVYGSTLTIPESTILNVDDSLYVESGATLNVYGILGVGGTVDISGSMYVDAYGNVGLGRDAQANVLAGGTLTNDGYFGVDGGTLNVEENGTFNNRGTVSSTWTEDHKGIINAELTRKNLYMPIGGEFDHDESDILDMLSYAQENGFTSTQVHFFKDYTFVNDFTVPENMTMMIGAYQNDANYSAATVTVSSGLTLTVDGRLEVAKKSSLILEEDAELIQNGECTSMILAVSNEASTGKIELTWSKVSGAAKYEVYRATSLSDTYSRLNTVTGTSLTDASAEAGKTYYYKVRSVADNGTKSEFSNIVTRTCDLPAPTVTIDSVDSTGNILLSWSEIEDAASYEICRSMDGGATYNLLGTTTDIELTDADTEAGSEYYYKVRAIHSNNSKANSAYSAEVSAVCELPSPTVAISNDAETGKPKVTWDAVPGAAKYKVYRATSKSGTYSLKKTVEDTSYIDTSATAEKTYYYYVVAVSAGGVQSKKSNVVSRLCDLARPEITLSNVASSGKIKVTWAEVEDAVEYKVYRATSEDGKYTLLKTTTSKNYTNTSADVGETYYYKVRAIAENTSANSAYSEIKSLTCKLERPVVEISVSASTGKINLEWAEIEKATAYEIYRSDNEDAPVATVTEISWIDETAVLGTEYTYRVKALAESVDANSAKSTADSAIRTLPRPTLNTMTNDAATGGNVVSWKAVEDAVGYEVYRASSKDGTYTLKKETTEESYTDTSGTPGKTYYYKVKAIAEMPEANSAFSSVKSRMRDLAQPVITLSNVASSGKIKVAWAEVEDAVEYEVYRATSEDGKFELVKTTTSKSYTNTSADVGETYYYKVRAIAENTSANSAYSEIKSLICKLERPVVEISVSASTGKINLEWAEIEKATAYEIYRSDNENTPVATVTEISWIDETAVLGTEYTYRVKALAENADANSAKSTADSAIRTLPRPTLNTMTNDAATGSNVVSWKAVEDAVGYEVYRASSKDGTYTLKKKTTGESYTDTSGTPGKTYYYKVKAIAEMPEANSAFSSVKSRMRDLAQPVITLSNVASSGKIKVAWAEVEDAVEYEVYRATSEDGKFELVKTTTSKSYTNTSAVAGETYYYKVRAIAENTSANSAYSEIKSLICKLERPTVTISNVASSGKIKLEWDEIEKATAYEIYRSDNENTPVATVTAISWTDNDEDAVVGTEYTYRVKALAENADANSAKSTADSAVRKLPRPVVSIAKNSKGKPKLTWEAVDGAVSYKVYRATSKSGTYSLRKTTTSTSYTDSNATSGKTYYYKVVAVASDTAANSAKSSVDSIKSE